MDEKRLTNIDEVHFLSDPSIATHRLCFAENPKNIVLILADDLGWSDTSLFGNDALRDTQYSAARIERHDLLTSLREPYLLSHAGQHHDGQNPARHGMTAPAVHLAQEIFNAVVNESGPPHQKSTNVRSSTRLDPDLPMLSELLLKAG